MTSTFGRRAGSRVLDFVNTLDWRDAPARRVELVPTAGALASWARHVDFPDSDARGIRLARHQALAVGLREVLATLFRAVADRRALPASALGTVTRWTRAAWRHRELTATDAVPVWRWSATTAPAARVLYALALEAADLLLSPDRDRIHVCAGEGCGWLFVDRSKAGRRRWCNMAACGNRAKVRDYRERVARG